MGTQTSNESRTVSEPGSYFRHMAQFVGFADEDAAAIKESQLVIEKHIPRFVSQFYDHLLRYPPTRKYFLKKSGAVDEPYLELRMTHLTTFWRRTASGEYDDEYAIYVDKVGLAHTSRGADPDIYIAERYVIGQIGFMQHAVTEALHQDLHEVDPDLEARATKAWNLLLMVLLEMLSRAYTDEHEAEEGLLGGDVDHEKIHQMAVDTYERGLKMFRSIEYEDFEICDADEIPDGERKIMRIGGRSMGIFHHEGEWYAVRNYCLHRSGPVATGDLEGDVLTCPWHGYQYDVKTGEFLLDPAVKLETYEVGIRDGKVHVQLPTVVMDSDVAKEQN
jgi:nitrite reductase/ring-hydroxylating ferredoxin subunit